MSCSSCKGFNIKIQNLIKESFLTEATTGEQIFSVNKSAVDKFLEPRVNACFVEIATTTSQKIVELKRSDYLEDAGFKSNINQIVEKYVNELLIMDNLKKLFSESITNSSLENFDLGENNSEKQNKVNNLANNIADSIGQILNYIQYVFGGLVPQMGIKAGDAAVRVNKLQKIKRSTKEETPPAVPLPNVGPGQTNIQEIKIRVLKFLKEDEERTSSRYFKGPASSEIYRTYQDLARWFKNHTPKDSIDEDVVDYVKMILSPHYEKKYGFQSINTSIDNTNYRITPDVKPEILSGEEAGKLVHQGAWQIYVNPKNDKWFPERTRPKSNYNPFDLDNPQVSKATDDIGHTILDILGFFDPTGIADGTNFLWYMNEYERAESEKEQDAAYFAAAASLIGAVLPYVGDLTKITKIGLRAKLAGGLLRKIKSFVSPKSTKLIKFFESLETLLGTNPQQLEKIIAETGISGVEIIRRNFLDLTREIIKARMVSPIEFIKSIKVTTEQAAIIRRAYLNSTFVQSIVYSALNSKLGIKTINLILSFDFDVAKKVCALIYSKKDIHETIQTLSTDRWFAETAEGKTALSRFRNLAIPYFEEIEEMIIEESIKHEKSLNYKEIKENKIKISIINKGLLNEGVNKEAIETVLRTIMRRSINIEAVIKSIDDILPSIIKALDSKNLLRILEKVKIRIRLTETDLSSIKRGITEKETKLAQLNDESKEISDRLFDLNRKTVKTTQENAEISDLLLKKTSKQKEIISTEEELTRLKTQTEPRIKEKETELQKLKEKETELNKKQKEIEQEPSRLRKLKDRAAGVVKGYQDWKVKYPRSNRILLTGLLYFVGNLICRSIAIAVLAWWAAKQTFAGSTLQKIEDTAATIAKMSGLGAIGGAIIIDAFQKARKETGSIIKGIMAMAEIIAMRLSVFVGCGQGARERLVTEAANLIDSTGIPASFDAVSKRFGAASEASEEEIQDALYGEFNDSWFNKLIDALPVPLLYGNYGKIGNQFLRQTDLLRLYVKTTSVGPLIAGYGINSEEMEEFAKSELKDKFFVSVMTAGQLLLIRRFLISKGINEPELQKSFITCLVQEMLKNLVITAKTQTPEQKKAFKERIEAISVFFKFNGDVLGLSGAAAADQTAIRNIIEKEMISLNEKLNELINNKKINLPGIPAGFGNNPDFNSFYKSINKHLEQLNQKNYNVSTGKKEIGKNYEILNKRIEEKITYYETKYPVSTPETERYKKNNIDFYKKMKEKNKQLYENVINDKITDQKGLNIELSQQDFYTCDKIKQEFSSVWNEASRIIDITKGVKIEAGDIVTFIATGIRFQVTSVQKEEGKITIRTDKGEEKFNQDLFTISEKGKK